MNKVFKVCIITVLSLIMVVSAYGQSIEERISAMAAKNAESYLNPCITAFGSALNSGWFYSAKPHKLLGFDIGLKGMYVTFPTDQKSFEFDITDLSGYSFTTSISGFDIALDAEDLYPNHSVPTFFGDKEEVDVRASKGQLIEVINDQLIEGGMTSSQLELISSDIDAAADAAMLAIPSLPIAGTGLEFFPFAVPQASIGLSIPMTPIKAEISGRYFPETEISEEIGKFSFWGAGGRLALDPFIPIPMFPINISAGYYIQQLKVGEIMEANASLLSLQAGKNLNLLVFGLGVYGSVGFESTSVDLSYTYKIGDTETELTRSFEGENAMRYSVGGFVKLAVFNVSAEYAMGADNVLTAGLAIAIR